MSRRNQRSHVFVFVFLPCYGNLSWLGHLGWECVVVSKIWMKKEAGKLWLYFDHHSSSRSAAFKESMYNASMPGTCWFTACYRSHEQKLSPTYIIFRNIFSAGPRLSSSKRHVNVLSSWTGQSQALPDALADHTDASGKGSNTCCLSFIPAGIKLILINRLENRWVPWQTL